MSIPKSKYSLLYNVVIIVQLRLFHKRIPHRLNSGKLTSKLDRKLRIRNESFDYFELHNFFFQNEFLGEKVTDLVFLSAVSKT